MDKFDRLKEIIETYKRFESVMKDRGITFGETNGGGFWVPTRWEHSIPFLEYATRRGVIRPPGPIVDAGSGDGRMSTLFDVYGLSPIINIELDKRLVDVSNEVLDDLVQRGIVRNGVHTVHGDFTRVDKYSVIGVPFQDVRYFYMGINGEPLAGLAERIRHNSRKGTKLIVYGMIDEGKEPQLPLKLGPRIRTKDAIADFLVYTKV